MKTIKRKKLSTMMMGCGKEKPTKVIDNGYVFQYVGIGWIKERKAKKTDNYPIVKE